MTNPGAIPDSYSLSEELPTSNEFVALREATGMNPRPRGAIEQGLSNSLYGVIIRHEPTGDTVGMGRVIGDDKMVYQISDMAVHPNHQHQGLGKQIMESLLAYIENTAPSGAEINLFADIDGFYEQFRFEETGPVSKGMVRFVK